MITSGLPSCHTKRYPVADIEQVFVEIQTVELEANDATLCRLKKWFIA
jgi:hypothetical protein